MAFTLKIINKPISLSQLQKHAQEEFGEFTKAVVDIEKFIMVVGGELHADEEALLLQKGSQQDNLRGINIYPTDYGTNSFIEFDSMINIRPRLNNRSRSVENKKLQEKIGAIVHLLVKK